MTLLYLIINITMHLEMYNVVHVHYNYITSIYKKLKLQSIYRFYTTGCCNFEKSINIVY